MKVYFIPAGYDGCAYVRCLLPQIHNGWWGAISSLRTPKDSHERMFKGAKDADIVVFQRPMQQEMYDAAIVLKAMGKKIVFDNDDTYRGLGVPRLMLDIIETQIDKKIDSIDIFFKEFAQISDLVTVSTPMLAKEYNEIHNNVVVLPNMVDQDDWSVPKRNEGDKVRIGVVGSSAMNKDSNFITLILRELGRREDVQLVMFGIPAKKEQQVRKFYQYEIAYWNTMNIEWQPSVNIADYMDTLNNLKLDILLIPREDTYFNRCKSNIKFLEASMCEVPVIAQGFEDGNSPYQHDEHIIVSITLDDWRKNIDKLIEDKNLRRKIGKDAKKYVLKKYNIAKTYKMWYNEYYKLIK